MEPRNDYIRDFLGVTAWHRAGYTGKRGLTLTAEPLGAPGTHAAKTLAAFREIAPEREVKYIRFTDSATQAAEFCDEAEASGADTMYMSLTSSSGSGGTKVLDARMPRRMSFFAAAGNDAGEAYNRRAEADTIYAVGACTLKYSASVNGKPALGAKLILDTADYSSVSEFVDFASITEFYLDGGYFDGTSCAAPVLCGMAALVNEFFLEHTGRPLRTEAMYRFFVEHCVDVATPGKDTLTGYGVPVLPPPEFINLWDYQEEAKTVTVHQLVEAAKAEVGVKESPPGSNNVKYNTAYYGREVNGRQFSWCLVFIWWLFRSLGAEEMFYGGRKTASCTTFYRWSEKRGMVVHDNYRPGDIVFYDWDHSGDCDHVGILAECKGMNCRVVEGNTAVGNDSNGGEVMMRERITSQFKGAVRLDFTKEDEEMTGRELIDKLTDAEAYELITKAQRHAAKLAAPAWAKTELAEAVEAGITDGENPMQLIPRYQAAIMAARAGK